eukprot:GHVO01017316.1.p1 GENE.GHVO01017316.1~~GHVO01017316.1.p1  ORF type:complete len:113 (-),score=19.30 GHVO01017316.1:113-451(-)
MRIFNASRAWMHPIKPIAYIMYHPHHSMCRCRLYNGGRARMEALVATGPPPRWTPEIIGIDVPIPLHHAPRYHGYVPKERDTVDGASTLVRISAVYDHVGVGGEEGVTVGFG